MKFPPGFCPAEAQVLLSLCMNPLDPLKTENATYLAINKGDKIYSKSKEETLGSFELGKHKSGRYYLVFRAEAYTQENIHQDLEMDICAASAYAKHPAARVQRSFLERFQALLPDLSEWLRILCENRNVKLYIAGHGRGAALATLCSAYLNRHKTYADRISPKVYLFGSPKVGNVYFAEELDPKTNKTQCFNIRHKADLISSIPYPPLINPRKTMSFSCFKDVGHLVLLEGVAKLPHATLTGTFSRHRAQGYAHYLKQQFPSMKGLGFLDE